MKKREAYVPSYQVSAKSVRLIAEIAETLAALAALAALSLALPLSRGRADTCHPSEARLAKQGR